MKRPTHALGFLTALGTIRLGTENLFDEPDVPYFSHVQTSGTNGTCFAGQRRSVALTFERRV